MRVSVRHRGSFVHAERFLRKSFGNEWRKILEKYGRMGVEALASYTPVDTGLTASSWYYEIIQNENGRVSVVWNNSNVINHVNIALIIQYGHATRNGGWVEGRDYINPALQPIFDKIAKDAWKEVSSSI